MICILIHNLDRDIRFRNHYANKLGGAGRLFNNHCAAQIKESDAVGKLEDSASTVVILNHNSMRLHSDGIVLPVH